MARMLTEDEVERLEKQRELQGRAQAATDPNALYNQRMAAAHAAAMERRRGYIESNPNAETDTTLRHQVLRDQELRAAHERGMEVNQGEWNTRIQEAEKKRLGMKEQGSDAATIRANAEKDRLDWNLDDKELQRQHEKALLGKQQRFQGTQNDAERKNKLEIAQEQGKSAVGAAKAQAEARAADIASKERIAQGRIDATNRATDTRAATERFKSGMATYRSALSAKDALGQPVFSDEQRKVLGVLTPEQLARMFGGLLGSGN